MYVPPFKNTFERLYAEHLNHFVQFSTGEIGFLVKPSIAVCPPTLTLDQDVHTSVGECVKSTFLAKSMSLALSLYFVQGAPLQETLTFRTAPIKRDTFLFRLDPTNASIRTLKIIESIPTKGMTVKYAHPSDFLPIVDKYGHFVGLSLGKSDSNLVIVSAKDIMQLIVWQKE